ncbi:MAG: hypothetical protein KAS23_02860 [Anaerohalosphaera sp.]|nr:hypothetical protein [Anaerohalosphaera sp.]
MKLPQTENPQRYVGLYVVDFGQTTSIGFTADEVAELLESEKFSGIKVYRIYNAYPDGKMELRAVTAETFQMEMGMFFAAADQQTAKKDFDRLITIAVTNTPPGRAKVQMSQMSDGRFLTALIYPAEYNDQFSQWLLDADYKTSGTAYGGLSVLQEYNDTVSQVIERHQLFGKTQFQNRTGDQLLTSVGLAVQR